MTEQFVRVRCPICQRLFDREQIEDHVAAHSLVTSDGPAWIWVIAVSLLAFIVGAGIALIGWVLR